MLRWQAWLLFSSVLLLGLCGALQVLILRMQALTGSGWRYVQVSFFALGWLGLLGYAWYRRDLLLGLGLVFFLVLLLIRIKSLLYKD
jgi:hypothetical protein